MANNCGTGGTVAGLTGQTPDCGDCRGIKNITQSADKLSITVYYTDGTSQIFSLPRGLTGATGSAGATGATGVVVLHNDIANSATAGTALEILKTYSMPLNTLATDGSYLEVRARFSTSTANTGASTKLVGIYFNGNLLNTISYTFNFSNVDVVEFVCYINRFSNTVAKTKNNATPYYAILPFMVTNLATGFANEAGLNLGTTGYDITARANSDVIGDLTCENLTVTLYNK